MDLDIVLEGDQANEQTMQSLLEELKHSHIKGLKTRVAKPPPRPGEMGAELVAIIGAVLAADFQPAGQKSR